MGFHVMAARAEFWEIAGHLLVVSSWSINIPFKVIVSWRVRKDVWLEVCDALKEWMREMCPDWKFEDQSWIDSRQKD